MTFAQTEVLCVLLQVVSTDTIVMIYYICSLARLLVLTFSLLTFWEEEKS